VGPGPAHGSQPRESSETAGVNAGPPGYGPWTIDTVVSSLKAIKHVSIAISPHSGNTYISYYEFGDLKMATYVGSGGNCGASGHWSCETVDSVGDVGQYSSIAINPTIDMPVISYYDATNEALKLAQWLGNSWLIKSIDGDEPYTSVGTHTSLKIDSSGVPHIAYHAKKRDLQANRLFYATLYSGATSRCTNGDFQCVPIDTAYDGYTSLDLNSHGHIGIAYQINKRLKYARFVPSPNKGNCGLGMKGWSCTYLQGVLLPDACATSYVSLDHDDGWHGAHVASYCGFLNYQRYVGTGGNCVGAPAWQCEEIDTMGDLPHTRDVSLVVDNGGFPIIAYHTYRQAIQLKIVTLNVARPAAALGQESGNCGPQDSWQCDRIPDIGDPGDYLSIALNPSGLATVAYVNSHRFGSSLRVAYQPPFKTYLPLALKSFAAP
jgi:hypothetical protein